MGGHRHVPHPGSKPWGLRAKRAVGMRKVGRAEFMVSRQTPALLGWGAPLSASW